MASQRRKRLVFGAATVLLAGSAATAWFGASGAVNSVGSLFRAKEKVRAGVAWALGRAPLPVKLPPPRFVSTPRHIPQSVFDRVGPNPWGPRPTVYAPKGVANVALGRPVTASDPEPIIGSLAMVTDGVKDSGCESLVEIGPDVQHVQIDLGRTCAIWAVMVWHDHGVVDVYRDVVIQIADEAGFLRDVRTVFNNDDDNSAGLGVGGDREYFDTYQGLIVDVGGVTGRHIRLYSSGCISHNLSRYAEVEVFGLPAR